MNEDQRDELKSILINSKLSDVTIKYLTEKNLIDAAFMRIINCTARQLESFIDRIMTQTEHIPIEPDAAWSERVRAAREIGMAYNELSRKK